MAKENLFEDITLEEAKAVLQKVSEYMDKVIKENKDNCPYCDSDNWNMAHDVLEMIHCPEQEDKEILLCRVIVDVVDKRIEQHIKVMRGEVQKAFDELCRHINQSLRR